MENENKVESTEFVQNEGNAFQGPISLPESTNNSEPVIEIASPSVEPTSEIGVQSIENSTVEQKMVVEPPIVENTPVMETPVVSVDTISPTTDSITTPSAELQQPTMQTPSVDSISEVAEPVKIESQTETVSETPVEQLETITPPAESPVESSAPQVAAETDQNVTPSLDPSLGVQSIEPALDEIAAENAPKKKSKKGLIAILLLIVAIVAAVIVYKFVILKPNKAYDQVFNIYKEKVSKALDFTIAPIESSVLESGNLLIETNVNELKDFNKLNIGYQIGVDYSNKKIELTADIKEDSKNILKVATYLFNNKLYLSSEQIYSKMLLFGNVYDTDSLFENVKASDISYILKGVGNHFIKALDNATYESQDTKIKIGDKSTLVTDNIMVINEKNLDKILKSFYKEIKEDNKLLEVITSISGIERDDVIAYIDAYLAEEHKYNAGEIRIHVYTKIFTTKVVGIKASASSNNETIDIFNAVFDKKDISINIMDKYKVVAKSTDGNNYDVTFYNGNDEVFKCKITKNGENNYTFETNYEEYIIKVTGDYKEENSDIIMKMVFDVNKGDEYLKVSIDTKTQYNMELGEANVSGAVDVNKLTSEDMTKIEKNVKKVINNSKALKSILSAYGYDDFLEESTSKKSSNNNSTDKCKSSSIICGECTGNTCECEYYNSTSSKWEKLTCPRNY